MKTVRRILSQLRRVTQYDGGHKRDRVDRTPVVEPMEPRALRSGMEPGLVTVVPPHHAGAEVMIPIHQPSSFHVLYQPIHIGELSASVGHASTETASTAQPTSAQTMNLTPAAEMDDDSGDGDGDGDDGDGDGDDGDGDDNNDEIDDENDP